MKIKDILSLLSVVFIIVAISCNKGPKSISPTENTSGTNSNPGIFSTENAPSEHVHTNPAISEDMHTVVAKEILQSTKYVYILVQEGNEEFWIATTKQAINKGGTYFYRGGLLKTNFESKEHSRTFDTIYLVSKLVSANHGDNAETAINQNNDPLTKLNVEGSVKIAELVANPEKYSGKSIQVSGECVKINPNIMGRNWIHLNDGSKKDYNLVITSDIAVPLGHNVTMVGTVILNKDFGAGYKYDILLENGTILK